MMMLAKAKAKAAAAKAAVLGGLTVGPAAVNAAVLELPRGSEQAVVVQITAESVRR